MRTIVIGDIHGCSAELSELLKKVDYNTQKDRLICVGDLLDKGPYGPEVVAMLKAYKADVVMGNHEEKFVRFHKHEMKRKADPKHKNPMRFSEQKYRDYEILVQTELIDWLATFPSFIKLGDKMVVVHAGVVPGFPIERQDPKQTIRVRYLHKDTEKMMSLTEDLKRPPDSVFWTDRWRGPYHVIYGHTAHNLDNPAIEVNEHAAMFGIDTGCVYGGRLTALILDENNKVSETVQVQAKTQYETYYLGAD